jgi:hypothetical protein
MKSCMRVSGRVKGVNMMTAVKALRSSREQAAKVLPPALHRYLEERVLVSSWYPEEDLLALLQALGRMLPPAPDPFAFMGRHTAREHLSGIYRGHVRPGNLEGMLTLGTALWRNYHDTGELTAKVESPQCAVLTLRNFAATSREFCRLLSGYFFELAVQGGTEKVDVVKLACSLDGADDCRWRMMWR